jgi:hypothetical protein
MVRCADCGFLSLRHLETRELREAEGDYRNTGVIPRNITLPKHLYEERPLCFQQLVTFDPEQCKSPEDRLAAIQQERGDCRGFTEWKQGFMPKEHREMLDRQWMIEREDRRDKEMREREDLRDKETANRHKEQMKDLRGQHWRELIVFGGLIGLATVVAAILDGAISHGWEPLWWPF